MRIGFDAKRAYLNYTGLGNYSRDLVYQLTERYEENEYYLYSPKAALNPRLSFLENKPHVCQKFPESPIHKTFHGFWRSINLEKFLIKDQIDIFHGLSNEIPRRRKFGRDKMKYVVTIHDLIFKRFPRNYKAIDRRIYNLKFKYAAKNADKVIAISEQTKNDLIKFYKIRPEKIEVVYQTCHSNFRKTYSDEIKKHIRKKFQLPEKYILNVGTIETRKNLNALVQAIPHMTNELPIVVVGRKTKYFNFLKVQMEKLKIKPGRFIFLSDVSLDELPSIYQMAEIFVYPSIFEGFGIPIIEALYSGTPVITNEGGCFPEAAGPDSCFIDPSDASMFGSVIDALLSDQNKRTLMSERGKIYAQRFNPQVLSEQIMAIYQSVNEKQKSFY